MIQRSILQRTISGYNPEICVPGWVFHRERAKRPTTAPAMSTEPLIWVEKAPLVPVRAPALPTAPAAVAGPPSAVAVAVTRGLENEIRRRSPQTDTRTLTSRRRWQRWWRCQGPRKTRGRSGRRGLRRDRCCRHWWSRESKSRVSSGQRKRNRQRTEVDHASFSSASSRDNERSLPTYSAGMTTLPQVKEVALVSANWWLGKRSVDAAG